MNATKATQAHARTLADYLQTIPASAIAAGVRGEFDVMKLLRDELANRGLDHQARWVGFEVANRLASKHD